MFAVARFRWSGGEERFSSANGGAFSMERWRRALQQREYSRSRVFDGAVAKSASAARVFAVARVPPTGAEQRFSLVPVLMIVSPAPVFALTLGTQSSVVAELAFPALLHQPVAIGAIFTVIPFVPIVTLAVIVAVFFFAEHGRRLQQHGR
jgi:hypothetical protein